MTPESALLYLELSSSVLMADAVQPLTDATRSASDIVLTEPGMSVIISVVLIRRTQELQFTKPLGRLKFDLFRDILGVFKNPFLH